MPSKEKLNFKSAAKYFTSGILSIICAVGRIYKYQLENWLACGFSSTTTALDRPQSFRLWFHGKTEMLALPFQKETKSSFLELGTCAWLFNNRTFPNHYEGLAERFIYFPPEALAAKSPLDSYLIM